MKVENVRVWIRFDRIFGPEHLGGGKAARELTILWPRTEAERVVRMFEECAPTDRCGFKCETHGDLMAYIDAIRIIEVPG